MPSLNTKLATAPNTSSNYVLKATTSTTIGNSLIFDNGTNVGIGNTNTTYTFDVTGTGRFTGALTAASATFSSADLATDGLGNVNIFTTDAAATGKGGSLAFGGGTTGGTSPYAFAKIEGIYDGSAAYNGAMLFSTNNGGTIAERMRITSSGNVGIGTSSPSKKLDIFDNNSGGSDDIVRAYQDLATNHAFYRSQRNGGANMLIGATRNNVDGNLSANVSIVWNVSNNDMAFGTNNTERMTITSIGQVLMNTNATVLTSGWLCIAVPSSNYNAIVLKDTGTTYSSGNYYQVYTNSNNGIAGGVIHNTASTVIFYTGPSDARLKSNIKNVDESILPLFNDVKLKTYNHIADEDESVVYKGFLAQEMVDKFPEAYALDKEGYYMYNPDGYIPYLVKAISELSAKLQDQQQTINSLINR